MITNIEGVAEIHRFGDGPTRLLVETPHGADTRAHYDALATRLRSPLPDHLERFFHVNTDEGAWAIARAAAEAFARRVPDASVLALRCVIPRTFIDVNRVLDADRSQDNLTPGLQPWITAPEDVALLTELHTRYTAIAAAAYAEVCGAGGRALIPHTYAPRSVPIARVDREIIDNLERVYQPGVIETAPLRAEIDLITETPEGEELAPEGLADRVSARLEALGYAVERNGAYTLHPVSTGARWSALYPRQVFGFEVRRDLVTYWEPFVPNRHRSEVIDALGEALAAALSAELSAELSSELAAELPADFPGASAR